VAQLVARVVRDDEAGSSSLLTPTIKYLFHDKGLLIERFAGLCPRLDLTEIMSNQSLLIGKGHRPGWKATAITTHFDKLSASPSAC
jgi:hypothetical protein